ncbi:hypothetical protein H1C71_039857 [Ictidomys tridecemlineatus]|nr:hypothetical protein H1C71_039857 [Ictidomys tridecemlineatus]
MHHCDPGSLSRASPCVCVLPSLILGHQRLETGRKAGLQDLLLACPQPRSEATSSLSRASVHLLGRHDSTEGARRPGADCGRHHGSAQRHALEVPREHTQGWFEHWVSPSWDNPCWTAPPGDGSPPCRSQARASWRLPLWGQCPGAAAGTSSCHALGDLFLAMLLLGLGCLYLLDPSPEPTPPLGPLPTFCSWPSNVL